jgi:hypothetical protein
MTNIKKILLDMDGVCCNFTGGTFKLFGVVPFEIKQRGYHQEMGITKSQFWKAIDRAGIEFWETLEPYEWLEPLIKNCIKLVGKENIAICTTPSHHISSKIGKIRWIQTHLGAFYTNEVIFTNRKHEYANSETLIIEDSEKNLINFYNKGGYICRVPQTWNSELEISGNRVLNFEELIK